MHLDYSRRGAPTRSDALLTRPLVHLYAAEGIVSAAATLLITGIFFYTTHRFGWELRHNFLLATAMGLIYIVGALSAHAVERWMGRRLALGVLYIILAGVCGAAMIAERQVVVASLLLGYTFLISITWPILEGMVSSDADPHQLSRRLGVYNLVWALTGSLAMALNGRLIEDWPVGVFALPAMIHVAAAVLVLTARQTAELAIVGTPAHAEPEPALLKQRQVALWLSRIALPATYVVIYIVAAILPSLPAIQKLEPRTQTVVGSVWLAARFVTFIVLGATIWWHTRPGVLFWAAVVMFIAFLGVVIPPSLPGLGLGTALSAMICAQIVLGAALGLVYTASLYFGMVLSQGSTEHSGYHEALIGLGQVVGPGVGAAALFISPGDLRLGIISVSVVVGLTVVAAAVARTRASREGRG